MEEAFNKNENTLAVIIDFKNAYDWVWRKKFLKDLKEVNIKGKMIKWIEHFLNNWMIEIKYNNTQSSF